MDEGRYLLYLHFLATYNTLILRYIHKRSLDIDNLYNLPFGHHRTNYRYKDTLFFVHPKYTSVDINKSGNEEQIRENPSGRVTEANGDVAECRHRQ